MDGFSGSISEISLIKICAEALGYSVVRGDARYKNGLAIATVDGAPVTNFDPLRHDAEAWALESWLIAQGIMRYAAGQMSYHHYRSGDRSRFEIGTDDKVRRRLAIVLCAVKTQTGRKS